jgi:hypothetical protein
MVLAKGLVGPSQAFEGLELFEVLCTSGRMPGARPTPKGMRPLAHCPLSAIHPANVIVLHIHADLFLIIYYEHLRSSNLSTLVFDDQHVPEFLHVRPKIWFLGES